MDMEEELRDGKKESGQHLDLASAVFPCKSSK